MRKKHCLFKIFITTLTTALILIVFMLYTPQAVADNGHKGDNQHKERQKEQGRGPGKHQKEMKRDSSRHRDKMGQENRMRHEQQPRESKYGREMKLEKGYREHPYDNRHYLQYDYKGHPYVYNGHWRSWDEWDRYRKAHPHVYINGRYYRDNVHLMFRFCEPETGTCFFFSIGR